MRVIELEEVKSGEQDGSIWIRLGFSSELSEYDVLHIVSPTRDVPGSSLDEVYFEHFDQANSMYGAAETVQLESTMIEFRFKNQALARQELWLLPRLRRQAAAFCRNRAIC